MSEEIKPGYVRVSEILRPFQDYSHIPPDILARKAEIGTEVHAAIEAFYKEDFHPLSSSARPYFHSFKSAFNTQLSTYTPLVLEKRLYSEKMHITGQIDAILTQGDSYYIFDWKTSANANERAWRMQLCLYALLVQENKICKEPLGCVLQLTKKNSFRIFEFKFTKKDYEIARALVKAYMYFNQ